MESQFLPFSDVVRISLDGEYVLLDPKVIQFPDKKFSKFRDFLKFAFENHKKLAPLYSLTNEDAVHG